ncbi:hypothetical protein AYI69_g1551 [Smittium culicis]|uniref:Uncharacterized protein n=1 Tax=Smittium culicis TaxID=133412 RepID=A0A1R1YQB5_9FUNG|nr:hypothetical protein AYI69_g1551 [Smittium culicis]
MFTTELVGVPELSFMESNRIRVPCICFEDQYKKYINSSRMIRMLMYEFFWYCELILIWSSEPGASESPYFGPRIALFVQPRRE